MATIIKTVCKEIRTLDDLGFSFLVHEEGVRLEPYLDARGVATIAVGNTYYENGRRVTMKDKPISRERAFSLFRTVLKTYEKTIWSTTVDTINQNMFNALVSICYNIGVTNFKGSTLLRRVNESNYHSGINEAFKMWKYAESEPILLPRRQREAILYFSPVVA